MPVTAGPSSHLPEYYNCFQKQLFWYTDSGWPERLFYLNVIHILVRQYNGLGLNVFEVTNVTDKTLI